MAKVSVIVPVYNVECFLAKCLDSLVNQTLDDMEIIVVNDGSTDRSAAIMRDFAERFPKKVKTFSKPNGGLSDARNFGLDRCTGQFFGFVDSDDYVTDTMFEDMLNLAEKHHAEMVICNLQKVDENGNISRKLTQIPHLPEVFLLKDYFSVFSDLGYFACNKLFSKELFREARFKKGVHFEDIQLIPQLLLKCKTIAQTQAYHYHYLERTNSISKTHTEKGLDMLHAVRDVEKSFQGSAFSDRAGALKNFQILQGVYSFLAYMAFVKDEDIFRKLSAELSKFMKERGISRTDILQYERFDKNYLLSLPLKKKIYYLLYIWGFESLLRSLIKNT